MSIIVILLAVGIGLLIGSRVATAHDAHEHFSRYRAASNANFGTWFKSAVTATVSIAVLILLIYAFEVHMNG